MDKRQDKIRLLFRHRSLELGGVEKVLIGMLKNLNSEKFDIKTVVSLHQGELRESLPSDKEVIFLARGKEDFSTIPLIHKFQLILRRIRLFFLKGFPKFTDRFIIKNNADIEIATGYTIYSDVLNSSNKNSKKIAWLHSDLTVSNFDEIRSKVLRQLEKFDFVIYGSQQIADIMKTQFPDVHIKNSKVILNAIDFKELYTKASQNAPILLQHPSFISVGRLHYRKGYRTLIESHAQLIKEKNFHHLYIIGDGPDRNLLENRISELGVSDTCHLLGSMVNPYPLVKKADFYVLPSESEGWPLIIAEALLLRKKIVATNVGGVPEMIESGKNGLLVEYTTSAIAKGMRDMMTNSELQSQIEINLEKIEEKFDNQKIYAAVENIFLRLMRGKTFSDH